MIRSDKNPSVPKEQLSTFDWSKYGMVLLIQAHNLKIGYDLRLSLGKFTLFPGWILSQTGGTIKVAAGKPYLRVVMYLYLSNFGAVIAMLVKSLTKIDNPCRR